MATSKACPKCGDQMNFYARAHGCGWSERDEIAAPRRLVEQDHGRCSWVSSGEQCHALGTISDDTHGSGRWLCADHHFGQGGAMAHRAVELSRGKPSNVADAVAAARLAFAGPQDDSKPASTPEFTAKMIADLRQRLVLVSQRKPGRGLSIGSGRVPPEGAGDAWEPAA